MTLHRRTARARSRAHSWVSPRSGALPRHGRHRALGRPRTRAVTLVVAVLAALLPVGVTAAAEAADAACLSESARFPAQRCDDVVAPETRLVSASPTVNRRGYLDRDDVTITFAGGHTDADTDPIAFECQLYLGEAPDSWASCTSPITYTDLDDTGALPYTFRARAVDTADRAIDATAGGLLSPRPAETDVADLDETPPSASFFVDTVAPNTFVFNEPSDPTSPAFPMLVQPFLDLELASTEPDVDYGCTLDRREVACAEGPTRFDRPGPGDHVLRVAATDPAGNLDETPTVTRFSVPTDLGERRGRGGFELVRDGADHFGGDYLRSTRRGATVRLAPRGARDLRILAPTGPRLGVVELQVGPHGEWVRLDQRSDQPQDLAVVYQRFFERPLDRTVTLRVRRAGPTRPALLDAVLLH